LPSVAVVIPVYNEAEILPNVLPTVQALTVSELCFVDGGSEDETRHILAASGVKYMQSLAGRAVQMNAGSNACKSDIILFIHADTILSQSHIEAIKECMQDENVVGGHFDVQLSGIHWMFRVIEWMMNFRSCLTGISTGDQCQFVRRSAFEKMGGFPEQALMEDIELSKRLKRLGKMVCVHEKVITSSRRWQKHGISRTILLMWKLRILYFFGVKPNKLANIYRNVR